MDGSITQFVITSCSYIELVAIVHPSVSSVICIGDEWEFLCTQRFHHTDCRSLVWAEERFAACTLQSSHGSIFRTEYIILAINLIGMMSFAHSRTSRNDDAFGTFDIPREIGFELSYLYFIVTMNCIDMSIVEEYREVVDMSTKNAMFPWSVS